MVTIKISLPMALLTLGGTAFFFNPVDDSFKIYFYAWLRKQLKQPKNSVITTDNTFVQGFLSTVANFTDQALATLVAKFSDTIFYNFMLFKVAEKSFNGRRYLFFGAFNTWFSLNIDQYNFGLGK